jgi:hypothetical protein
MDLLQLSNDSMAWWKNGWNEGEVEEVEERMEDGKEGRFHINIILTT